VRGPPQLARDLARPSWEEERRWHKKKWLVQSPSSYFMDVKCPGEGPRRSPPRNVLICSGGVGVGV